MKNKAIIIANIHSRAGKLVRLVSSMSKHLDLSEYAVYIVAQGYQDDVYDKTMQMVTDFIPEAKIIRYPKLIGAYHARLAGIEQAYADGIQIFCNVDDDVTYTEKVNYQPIVEKLQSDRKAGLISGGWTRSLKMASNRQTVDKYVKQPIIYTGGGMFFRRDVAELLMALPKKQYLYDDVEISMRVYIAGYDNYRYRGSLVVAEVGNLDGRLIWTRAQQRELPDQEYIKTRQLKPPDQNGVATYAIPFTKDLTDRAKKLHKENSKNI